MTVKELIEKLQEVPMDAVVTVRGYEGGVDEVRTVDLPATLVLDVHEEWYYGKHEYLDHSGFEDITDKKQIVAVHIG